MRFLFALISERSTVTWTFCRENTRKLWTAELMTTETALRASNPPREFCDEFLEECTRKRPQSSVVLAGSLEQLCRQVIVQLQALGDLPWSRSENPRRIKQIDTDRTHGFGCSFLGDVIIETLVHLLPENRYIIQVDTAAEFCEITDRTTCVSLCVARWTKGVYTPTQTIHVSTNIVALF